MSAFFRGLGNLISQIFRNIRPVGLVLLALATVLIGLRIITTNETLAPLVLPAFASFWVTAFYFARREDLKEPVKGRLAALTAGLWATFAAGIVLREAVPILFALWTFGYLPVWFLIFIIVLLWPGRDGDKRPKLLAKEGRLFEVKKLGEDLFEETPIPGWAYKKAEIEVWADTAVVVDKEGAKPRVIRHTSDPDEVIIDKTETVRAIVDLRQQIRREDAVPVMTRDGIAVKIDLFVGFQLERHARPSLEDPYPVLDSAVIRAVYKHAIFDHADDAAVEESEQQTDWYDYPLYRLKIRLHDIIAQYALSELYEHLAQVPPGPEEDAALRIPRRRIAAELVDRAFIDELRREVAIEIIPENTGIGAIEFADEDIKKAVWDQWKRQRDQEIDWQLLPGASRMQADRMLTMLRPLQGRGGAPPQLTPPAEDQPPGGGPEAGRVVEEPGEASFVEGDFEPIEAWLRRRLGESEAELEALESQTAERLEAARLQLEKALLEYVEVYDIVNLAIQRIPPTALKTDRYAQGLNVIHRNMRRRFTEMGLEEVQAEGHELDTRVMEAVEADDESTLAYYTVSRVVKPGFYYRFLGERHLLRVAEVAVSTGTGSQPATGGDAPPRRLDAPDSQPGAPQLPA